MNHFFKSRSSPVIHSEKELAEALRTSVIRNETNHVKSLLKKINVDYILDANHKTALYLASQYGHCKLVKLLLNSGGNPNCRCVDGSTPVHAACFVGDPHIVSALIEAGGDLRLHDNDGRGVKEWTMKHPDEKKTRTMIMYIEKCFLKAIANQRDSIASPELPTQPTKMKKTQKQAKQSKNAMYLSNVGFGKITSWSEGETGEPNLLPVITEANLTHDKTGITYSNGNFMIMECMRWNHVVPVTVKRLRKARKTNIEVEMASVDELINENNYMLRLRHPNILLLLAVCPIDSFENVTLVYERVSCGSLHTVIYHSEIRFSRRSLCDLFVQLCDAVLYLHYLNLVHSYITTYAVQVMSSLSYIKLANFEYMVESNAEDNDVFISRNFSAAMANWLAPEIFSVKKVSRKSDIYGICIVLWEVLHDEPPFADLTTYEIEIQNSGICPRVLQIDFDIKSPFSMILDNGLQVDPSNRTCKIKDIRNMLEQASSVNAFDEVVERSTRVEESGFLFKARCRQGPLRCCDMNNQPLESTFDAMQMVEDAQLLEQDESTNLKETTTVKQPSTDNQSVESPFSVQLVEDAQLKEAKTMKQNSTSKLDMAISTMSAPDVLVQDVDVMNKAVEASEEITTGKTIKNRTPPVWLSELVQSDFGGRKVTADGETLENKSPSDGTTDLEDDDVVSDEHRGLTGSGLVSGDTASFETELQEHSLHSDDETSEKPDDEKLFGHRNQLGEQCADGDSLALYESSEASYILADEADDLSADAGPSHPVSEDFLVPTIVDTKKMSYQLWEDANGCIRGSIVLLPQETTDKKLSDTSKGIAENELDGSAVANFEAEKMKTHATSLRHSIESLRNAFFQTSGVSVDDRQVSAHEPAEILEGRRSNSEIALNKIDNTIDANPVKPELFSGSKPSAETQVPELSYDLTSESVEMYRAFINKPLPPLPRAYIKQTHSYASNQKPLLEKPAMVLPELDSSSWFRESEKDNGSKVLQERFHSKGSSMQKSFGTHGTSTMFRQYLYETSTSRPEEKPLGSLTKEISLSQESNSSTQEAFEPKLEAPVFRQHMHDQSRSLQSSRLQSSKTIQRGVVSSEGWQSAFSNLDFLSGFKPASHHVPSMMTSFPSTRATQQPITGGVFSLQKSPYKQSILKKYHKGSYVTYKQEENLCFKEPVDEKPFEGGLTVGDGAFVKKAAAVVHRVVIKDKNLEQQEVLNSPESISTIDAATVPSVDIFGKSSMKSYAVSAQMFCDTIEGQEGTKSAAKSAEIIGQRTSESSEFKRIDVRAEVMGDHMIANVKKDDSLEDYQQEVPNSQNPEGKLPDMEDQAIQKVATMKAGTSLTLPASQLLDEADIMHRFKSDPLLQRDITVNLAQRDPAQPLPQNKTSEGPKPSQGVVQPVVIDGKLETKTGESSVYAENVITHTQIYKSVELPNLESNISDVPDLTLAKSFKETEEEASSVNSMMSSNDEATGLVESAITDALDQIERDHHMLRCPHLAQQLSHWLVTI